MFGPDQDPAGIARPRPPRPPWPPDPPESFRSASKAIPRNPAAGARRTVSGPDGRQVGPPVLTRLHQLHQHARPAAARASAAQRASIASVPSDGLDRQHDPLLHHAALADIDRAQRPSHRNAAPISAIASASGAARLSKPARRQRLAQHLVRADHAKPLLAQHPDHRGKQPVIARRRRRARSGPGCARPPTSGRRSSKEGRRTGPTSTSSRHSCAVQRRKDPRRPPPAG